MQSWPTITRVHVISILVLAVSVAAAGGSETDDATADAALMAHLRKQIEAFPPDEQEAKGLQVLLDSVSSFKTEASRQRVLLSIGDLYKRRGDAEKALEYHSQASGSEPDAGDVGGAARDRVLESLYDQGDFSALITRALEFRSMQGLSDREYATLTHRAGNGFLRLHRTAEAVDLAIDSAKTRPSADIFHVVETLANGAATQNDKSSYSKGMRWLRRESGEFARTLRFLRNLGHAEEEAGDIGESLKVRKEIVHEYPNTVDAAQEIGNIVRLCMMRGDQQTAQTYSAVLQKGNYPEKYKSYAARVQGRLEGNIESPPISPTPAVRKPGRGLILLLNALAIVGLLIAVWVRTRSKRSG